MIAEIPVRQRIHEVLRESLEKLGGAQLRNALVACVSANRRIEGRHGNDSRTRECAVRRGAEIGVELPDQETGAVARIRRSNEVIRHEVVRRTGRRRNHRSVQVGGNDSALGVPVVGHGEENLLGRRIADQHLRAIECEGAAVELAAEDVRRHVVRIRPHAELRVVGKVGVADRKLVLEPGAGRIVGDRDRDALRERPLDRELAHQPAIGLFVVLDDRVAVIRGLADAAQPLEHRVAGKRAQQQRSGLVVHRPDRVDVFDVVIGADVAVVVGRNVARPDDGLVIGVREAVELDQLAGLRRPHVPLHDGIDDLSVRSAAPLGRRHVVTDLSGSTRVDRPDELVVAHRDRLAASHRMRDSWLLGRVGCEQRRRSHER